VFAYPAGWDGVKKYLSRDGVPLGMVNDTTAAAAEEEAEAAVPEATSAEEATARAATVPEEVDTATRRFRPESVAANAILRIQISQSYFLISLCKSYFDKCHYTVFSISETLLNLL
jgi:hypothetical protein